MIATLDDVIEEIADEIAKYGAHDDSHPVERKCPCRTCFTSGLRDRIIAAVEVEGKLGTLGGTENAE